MNHVIQHFGSQTEGRCTLVLDGVPTNLLVPMRKRGSHAQKFWRLARTVTTHHAHRDRLSLLHLLPLAVDLGAYAVHLLQTRSGDQPFQAYRQPYREEDRTIMVHLYISGARVDAFLAAARLTLDGIR